MFVAGLVDEIIRKIDQTRRRHGHGHGHNHGDGDGRNSSTGSGGGNNGSEVETYRSFMARQKELWTPPDLFDRCCARWLAGGGNQHDGNQLHHKINASNSSRLSNFPEAGIFDQGSGPVSR